MPGAIDAYLASQPEEARQRLVAIRDIVCEAVPEAQEVFSYQMPGFKLAGKPLLYYGGFQKHVSLFGATGNLRQQMPELAAYKGGKGTIQFPLDKPLPVQLIKEVVRHGAKETGAGH